MRVMRLSAVVIAIGLVAAVTVAEAADLSVKDEMKQVVEPASSALFSVAGDADPANGPDAAKVPDARWKEAADAALKLKEVADKLNDAGRAKAGAEWAGYVKDFGDQSAAALKAAQAKDGAGLAIAAKALSDDCSACHAKYKSQGG
jgi:cytochrome c556